jgi:hypothetical protein
MKVKIISYQRPPLDYWKCIDIETKTSYNIDLTSDGTFPEFDKDIQPYSLERWFKLAESLVGKTIEIERIFPFMYCASNIKIIKP